MTIAEFERLMENRGWVIFERAISDYMVARMLDGLASAYETCRAIQVANGVSEKTEFTVHHLVGQGQVWLDFLEAMPIGPYIERYFGGKYILNSFGGAINSAHSRSYAHEIHRDIRSFSGRMPLLLNTLVMLDDFTADNGATFLLPGGHKMAEKPGAEWFNYSAERAIAPRGSILMFNSNLWHAGGDNDTDKPRRSVTPMFCRPWVKPGFDYPRAVGYDRGDELSPYLRQLLGYNARIPATLNEWYQPPEKRMYMGDQG